MRSLQKKLENMFGQDAIIVEMSSQFPEQIIDNLIKIRSEHGLRPVVIGNRDAWRYGNHPKLLDFLNNDGRKFYFLTLGYTNKKISDNIFELSWPWFYLTRPTNNAIPRLDKKCHFGFSCLNNRTAFHRLVLGHLLWKNCLIDDMIFTQNLTILPGGYYSGVLDRIPDMRKYISTLPISWPIEVSKNFASDHSIRHQGYLDSYCNIATESEIQDFIFEGPIINLPVITEKSYKPFRSMQVPIWFAAPGQVAYLRSLGFETMDDLLPPNYDAMGTYDKSQAIVDVVKQGHGFIEDFYHRHLRELQHNYDLIRSDEVDNLILENLQSFFLSA